MSIQTVFFAEEICKETIAVVQINLGDRCNQVCTHCHIWASPQGKKNMDAGTVHRIIERLQTTNIRTIEFTGGTPELNPHLGIFIEELSGGRKELAVRTSLTVLDLPEYTSFVDLYRRHKVKIIASLPSVLEEETERQRGRGVFKKSIRVLKRLNALGYGNDGYALDLVHNPVGDSLPDDCDRIEREYRRVLRDEHGISFNRLITITNSPVGRFREGLEGRGTAGSYHDLLTRAFNSKTLKNVMCRHLLSLDHEGFLYDCDFKIHLPGNQRLQDLISSNSGTDHRCPEGCCQHNRPQKQEIEVAPGKSACHSSSVEKHGECHSLGAGIPFSGFVSVELICARVGDILQGDVRHQSLCSAIPLERNLYRLGIDLDIIRNRFQKVILQGVQFRGGQIGTIMNQDQLQSFLRA